MNQDKQQTVLFLPAWYPNRYDKMGGMFARQHAIALKDRVKVHVLHVSGQKQLKRKFEFVTVNDEVPTYIMYYKKFKTKTWATLVLEAFLYMTATLLAYSNYRKIHSKPNIYHVQVLTRAAMLPLLLSFFGKTKYVITEHWSRYLAQDNSYHGVLRKFLTKLAVKRSAGLSTVSNALKQGLLNHKLDHPNFPLISNVVPTPFFEDHQRPKNEVKRFLHVSCFDNKSKNITGILKAAEILINKKVPFQLYLVGDGPDKTEMQRLAQELNSDHIIFTGELLGETLIEQYHNADALILFSNFENQPCVILEAHVCGLPVIGSEVGGIPELVNDENGVLVEVGNYIQLALTIERFVQNGYDFNAEKIKKNARSKYSSSAIAHQILDFYTYN